MYCKYISRHFPSTCSHIDERRRAPASPSNTQLMVPISWSIVSRLGTDRGFLILVHITMQEWSIENMIDVVVPRKLRWTVDVKISRNLSDIEQESILKITTWLTLPQFLTTMRIIPLWARLGFLKLLIKLCSFSGYFARDSGLEEQTQEPLIRAFAWPHFE